MSFTFIYFLFKLIKIFYFILLTISGVSRGWYWQIFFVILKQEREQLLIKYTKSNRTQPYSYCTLLAHKICNLLRVIIYNYIYIQITLKYFESARSFKEEITHFKKYEYDDSFNSLFWNQDYLLSFQNTLIYYFWTFSLSFIFV